MEEKGCREEGSLIGMGGEWCLTICLVVYYLYCVSPSFESCYKEESSNGPLGRLVWSSSRATLGGGEYDRTHRVRGWDGILFARGKK